jgi:multidrug resistance efflux pump
MDVELQSLRIDRSKPASQGRSWTKLLVLAVVLMAVIGAGLFAYAKFGSATEVKTVRVRVASSQTSEGAIILNATGYIIAAHKIEVASKVVGRVAWIGVEKGDTVKQNQILVRLEDDEYRAQVLQARGNLENLKAKLAEAVNGSRPEEIARAKADVDSARADLENYRINLDRTRKMVESGILMHQNLDDDQAKYDNQFSKVASLTRTYDLAKLGPRREEIDSNRAQVKQAQGSLDYAQTQLDNTVIRAPVDSTILERNVEKGEFVTTGFVGDKGAKGYVVSLANLNDLQVELDINQNDFAKLKSRQPGTVTTDAYPDRKYQGEIEEISPEANRQKATVQVKVRIENPDGFLRPDMNASVAFYKPQQSGEQADHSNPPIVIPLRRGGRQGGSPFRQDGRNNRSGDTGHRGPDRRRGPYRRSSRRAQRRG